MAKSVRTTRVQVYSERGYNFPTGLVEAIAFLQGHLEAIPKAHRGSARIEIETEYERGDSYTNVVISYLRPMTKAELAKDSLAIKAQKQLDSARELELLTKLLAKHGAPKQ